MRWPADGGASAAELVALGASCALAFVPLSPLFADWGELAFCAGAVVVAFAAHGAARRLWRRDAAAAAVAVAAVAVWTTITACRDEATARLPGPAAWAELWRGLTGGWSLMLTAGVPFNDTGAVAVPPVLGAGLVAVAALQLRRTQRALWPVLPPLVALVVTCGYAGHLGLPSHPLVMAALVASVLTVLAMRGSRQEESASATAGQPAGDQRHPVRPRIGSTPVLIAAMTAIGVAAALAVPLAADDDRLSLRELYAAPVQINDAVSPLTQVSAELGALSGGDRTAFRVTFESMPAGVIVDRVSIAVLDRYDGSVWTNPARFDRAGSVLPLGWVDEPTGPTVRQRFELSESWSSSFVPVAGHPRHLDGTDTARFGFDGDTATLVSDRAPGASYEVSSVLPVVERDALLDEPVSSDQRATASAALPSALPPELTAFLAEVGGPGDPAGSRLAALEEAFRSARFGFSPQAAPGHSLGRIAAMLPTPGTAGAGAGGAPGPLAVQQVGTPEQFASAFAVLARLAGYPARVVVGYRIDPEVAAAGAPVDVRAADITAWPEVLFEHSGWVAYDPTNPTARDPEREADSGSDASVPSSAPLESQAVKNCLELGTCLEAAGGGSAPRTIAAFVLLSLLVAIPAGLLMARTVQRQRRRRGPAASQVVGAWRTCRDRLRLDGMALPPGTTVLEAAQLAATRPARPIDPDVQGDEASAELRAALEELAPLVDSALFDPAGPHDDAAAAAWRCEQRVGAAVARRGGLPVRLRAAFDPRPLLWAAQRPRVQLGPVSPRARRPATAAAEGVQR